MCCKGDSRMQGHLVPLGWAVILLQISSLGPTSPCSALILGVPEHDSLSSCFRFGFLGGDPRWLEGRRMGDKAVSFLMNSSFSELCLLPFCHRPYNSISSFSIPPD